MIRGVRPRRRRHRRRHRRRFVGSVDDAEVDADARRRRGETGREDAGGEVVRPRERGGGDNPRAAAAAAAAVGGGGTRIERKRSGLRR